MQVLPAPVRNNATQAIDRHKQRVLHITTQAIYEHRPGQGAMKYERQASDPRCLFIAPVLPGGLYALMLL
jgi:hypothetical protein